MIGDPIFINIFISPNILRCILISDGKKQGETKIC